MTNERYLKHLADSLPKSANNYMLSTYSIILEAWRRGLEIKIRILVEATGKIEPYFTISSSKRTHNFSATRGDKVTPESKDLVKNKKSAKEYLQKHNVPTPDGKYFDKDVQNETIISYANDLGYPVVIKPVSGTGGEGVIAYIENDQELINALQYVRVKLKNQEVILEKFFKGEDYRLYVIEDKVVAALKRLPAHVIGDGKNTIRKLVALKNEERTKNPALTDRPIKINQETRDLLKKNNYTLDSIPEKGDIVYLKTKNNVTAGGDSIDVTDEISENIKSIAIRAREAFPDLPQCGIDLLVNEENDEAVVIEINSRAHITQHLFPMQGTARDVPSAIIDYYFPESIENKNEEANQLFLDFDYIYNSCLSGSAQEIILPKIPSGKIKLTRFLISNCIYNHKLAVKIRRQAFNFKLNGYIKQLNDDSFVIVVGGDPSKINKFKTRFEKYIKKQASEANVIEKSRNTPIKHGFTIEDMTLTNESNKLDTDLLKKYSKRLRDYQKLVRKLAEYEQREKVHDLTEKQNKKLKKKLEQMEKSTSWKLTKPIRSVTKIFKS